MNRKHFTVVGKTITVDNDNIQAFEYPDGFTAQQEIDALAEKYTVSTRSASWKKNVHLYARGTMAVFYLGNNPRITVPLEESLGIAVAIPVVRTPALTQAGK